MKNAQKKLDALRVAVDAMSSVLTVNPRAFDGYPDVFRRLLICVWIFWMLLMRRVGGVRVTPMVRKIIFITLMRGDVCLR